MLEKTMNKSEAFLNGWLAHRNDYVGSSPYHETLQEYSHKQWHSGWRARQDFVETGSSDFHPDAECENL